MYQIIIDITRIWKLKDNDEIKSDPEYIKEKYKSKKNEEINQGYENSNSEQSSYEEDTLMEN